ncbi:MAG TPA: patatin-like phospholipase family protein [Flavitalea sp.]|nr:patatin-like phospholipase family protein [Flavitalea sp.]
MPPHFPKTGLSLSGGGYRAAAFHLGTLKKLKGLGILDKIDIISTISGGSITGAYYALHADDYDYFEKTLYNALQDRHVVKNVLLSTTFFQLLFVVAIFLGPAIYFLFTPHAWLFPILFLGLLLILFKFQFTIFPVSKRIETLYDRFFYHKKTLKDLPAHPLLVIGSTNLQTAKPFTFSKNWMQDTTYQYVKPKITFVSANFPVSRAVMASSCVPFAFTPVNIAREFFTVAADADRVHPMLVDGGVYDNQGIHKIMQEGQYSCDFVITSDAGGGDKGELTFKNTIALLLQTVEVFMQRIKNVQMVQDIYDNASGANKEIAYLSLGWDVERSIPGFVDNLEGKHIPGRVIAAHQLLPEWVADPKLYRETITRHLERTSGYHSIPKPTPEEKKIARTVGTNLTALSKSQVDCLIKQAMALTEIQIKLYCPSVFK